MYLNKNQEKAIDIALDALDFGIRNGIQEDDSRFATDILVDMIEKNRKRKGEYLEPNQ